MKKLISLFLGAPDLVILDGLSANRKLSSDAFNRLFVRGV